MQSILIVDNNDSFTYNLVEMLRQTKLCMVEVCMLEHVSDIKLEKYNGVILSPGPGLPREKKGLFDFIESVDSQMPLLGVCLGHQAIAEYYGAQIVQLNKILHGESSEIVIIEEHKLFDKLAKKILVGRYHSWIVDKNNLPKHLNVLAETNGETIMAICHKTRNICSVQFHPESILTPKGKTILENWLVYCVEQNKI